MPIISQQKLHEGEDMTQIKKIELGNILVTTLCLVADPGRNDAFFACPAGHSYLCDFLFFSRNKGRGRVPPGPSPRFATNVLFPLPVVATIKIHPCTTFLGKKHGWEEGGSGGILVKDLFIALCLNTAG